MRIALLIFAWLSLAGVFTDGLIGLYAWRLVLEKEGLKPLLSVDYLLREYIGFLYWIKHLAMATMPDRLANGLFSLPAIYYFPVKVILNLLISGLAFRWASRIKS